LRRLIEEGQTSPEITDLVNRCQNQIESLTTKSIGEAAMAGNQLARDEYVVATRVLGWAIAQVITVVAPEVVVVGGGVSLVGEEVFFAPLRNAVRQYAFPPLSNSYKLLPAALGESVVVHGALALARLSH
jgi:glucokinase